MTVLLDVFFIQKIILALMAGALIGLERQYSKKEGVLGLRTFSLISLLGAVSVILSEEMVGGNTLVILGFIFAALFGIGFYFIRLMNKKARGFTTGISLVLSYPLGVLAGYGFFLEAIFLSILIALILFSKERLHNMVEHLTEREVVDLLEFLILLGIVYPIMPHEITAYGINVPLFTIWFLIVVISLINFASFIGARHLSAKHEIETVSFLSGIINGWAAVFSLVEMCKNKGIEKAMSGGFLLVNSANFIRIVFILILMLPFISVKLIPATLIAGAVLAYFGVRKIKGFKSRKKLSIKSPFNVKQGVKFALIMLALFIIYDLISAYISGFFMPAIFLTALINSTAAIATLVALHSQGVVNESSVLLASFLIILGGLASNILFALYLKKGKIVRKVWKEHAAAAILFAAVYILTNVL